MGLIFLVALACLLFTVHFLPAIIASRRHARNFGWILVVNIFLSWTLVGWVVALIWAIRDEPRYYYVPALPGRPYNL
jgi:Superinfection immunity protein